MGPYSMEDFDRILLETIMETFDDSIGEVNTQIIFQYIENRSCPLQDIPQRLAFFSSELRKIFGFGRGMMLGSAVIFEQAITERFCRKIGAKYSERGPFVFASFIEKLREEYAKGERGCIT
jgi:hypothetical protein